MDKVLEFTHKLLNNYVTKDDCVVDATMGNGNDTLVLANLAKLVYAFDIQENALLRTKKRLSCYNNIVYISDSHENVLEYIKVEIKAFVFNLGYLPNGNKQITTMAITTIRALQSCLSLLKEKGIITIVIYPGHLEGKKEEKMILDYVSSLDQKAYDVLQYAFINQVNNPPFLIVIEKK